MEKKEKVPLHRLSKSEYARLKSMGKLETLYPRATGEYHIDSIKTDVMEYKKK